MPVITTQQLVDDTRVLSGLMDNQYLDDTQIITLLNDAYQELDDTFTASVQHWRRKSYDFTLSGGVDGNSLDLAANVPDFQMTQGVDDLANPQHPRTVDRLTSFTQRNGSDSLYSNNRRSKQFFEDGNLLFIYPANHSAGSYTLIYTPQTELLALPVLERTFAVNGADQPGTAGPGPSNAWLLGGANFVAEDVGRTLIPAFATPNEAWNIPYLVTDFFSATAVAVTPDPNAIGVFDQPPSGSWSVYEQPLGTVGALPVLMSQWATYLKLYASIAIRESQELEVGELERKLNALKVRIKNMSNKRSEGVAQAPITRNRHSWGGGWDY